MWKTGQVLCPEIPSTSWIFGRTARAWATLTGPFTDKIVLHIDDQQCGMFHG